MIAWVGHGTRFCRARVNDFCVHDSISASSRTNVLVWVSRARTWIDLFLSRAVYVTAESWLNNAATTKIRGQRRCL